MEFFATTARGLEDVLAEELTRLGVRKVTPTNGGVSFAGSLTDGYRACLWLRTANRVLQPIASFPCPSQEALYEGVYAIEWQDYLTTRMTLAVDATLICASTCTWPATTVRSVSTWPEPVCTGAATDEIRLSRRSRRPWRPDSWR
jgi:23S rRNA G2445 N2-methylase RlmL